jgi:hypothetical protein
MKNDCSLFSRLYISSQIGTGDLDKFFRYENQARSPALTHIGIMRTDTKSDLLGYLEDLAPVQQASSSPIVQVAVLDGAAIINMLRPGAAKTFQDYATDVLYRTSHHSCSMLPD